MTLPRHNLPKRASHFIGRERDVTDLRQLFDSTRMITLTGAGGIGKTRLAVRVAETMLAGFDRVRFADLSEAVGPDAAVRAVADTLRVVDDRGVHEAIIAMLRPQRFLLILDTCEPSVGPLADLCTRLLENCPDLRILATSREPLRIPGETIWRVPPLSVPARTSGPQLSLLRPPEPDVAVVPGTSLRPQEALRYEAVRLFVVRAGSARPGFEVTRDNLGQVIELCRMLDGVPLAIELAAARVRVLSVRQILARLDDQFRLLVGTARDLPARQRTIRATVEWSHDLLSDDEQTLLRRLSVFATWSMRIAEEVCAFDTISREQILDLHASLLDKSLVTAGPEVGGRAHYHLLDTVRGYAAERLTAAGEEALVRDRHLDFAVAALEDSARLAVSDLSWPERLAALRRTDHHRENTRRLLAWARGHRPVDGLRFCVALRSYWAVRDATGEVVAHIGGLLEETANEAPSAIRARALALYAELTLDGESVGTAASAADAALKEARNCADPGALTTAYCAMAQVGLYTGDPDTAHRWATETLDLARDNDDLVAEIVALNVLGSLLLGRDRAAARALFEQSLAVSESINEGWSIARGLTVLGVIDLPDGDPEVAARALTTALRLFDDIGSARDSARCCAALGRLAIRTGDHAEARSRLVEAMRLSIASGRRLSIARAVAALAELAVAEDQPVRAAALAGAADSLRTEAHPPGRASGRIRAFAEERLGADTAQSAWHSWRSLSVERIVNEAVEFPTVLPSVPLTPRETEIAQLVGAGLSNRDIAERLTITSATAARHIANIFGKLGVTSRDRLAEWARANRR
ncbi:ATP-binding protein [Murinocardiopsis flavida]|nr:LuxR C-terminal-related transcriptional regulator [Murinocardiopsis flavida]